MVMMSKRAGVINLGDPLPLSYVPVRKTSLHNQNQQHFEHRPHTSQSNPNPNPNSNPNPSPSSIPMHNTNESLFLSHVQDLRLFITNKNPYIRSNLTTRERVKTKLRQLVHDVNELEQIEEGQLLEFEERLNDLFELLHQETQKQMEMLEQEINTEDEIMTQLENTRSNLQKLKRINKRSYWFIFVLLFSIGFLLSSLIMADFKYQYCYYFC